jgi:hypothetical protein
MNDRLSAAVTRTGTIAAGFFAFWVYRCQSRGDALSSKRVLVGAALILVALAAALGWEVSSNVKGWTWWMSALGFTLCLIIVCVAVVIGLRFLA